MELTIAAADVRDAGQILDLQYLCYQTEAELYDDYAIPPLTQNLASLLAEYETRQILAAKLADEVVGSVRGRLADDACAIGRLIVHPRVRRRGIGTRLMHEIEKHFSDAVRYELFTGHLSEGNLRLYGRLAAASTGIPRETGGAEWTLTWHGVALVARYAMD
jgi:ribosomal protein S18 acetylase RimI-like enzyme